eukprot:PhF_6_TR7796/c0_g1_i1/m.11236
MATYSKSLVQYWLKVHPLLETNPHGVPLGQIVERSGWTADALRWAFEYFDTAVVRELGKSNQSGGAIVIPTTLLTVEQQRNWSGNDEIKKKVFDMLPPSGHAASIRTLYTPDVHRSARLMLRASPDAQYRGTVVFGECARRKLASPDRPWEILPTPYHLRTLRKYLALYTPDPQTGKVTLFPEVLQDVKIDHMLSILQYKLTEGCVLVP